MLQINDLTYRLGERLLIDHTTVTLHDGAKVGLVGRNGTGKTTLFRLIAGDISPESGIISLPRGRRIGRVAQEVPGGDTALIDVVLAADTERAALLAESTGATQPERIAEIETRLIDIDAHAAPARAAAILHGLGFDENAQRQPCSAFSGGWRMRVALAAVLFAQPDLLMLDEPTNYLDLEGTLWLYSYLARYPHGALIISHDRELLDTVASHILHLDQGKLTLYRGGYESFERQRREKQALQLALKNKQDDERRRLSAFVDRFRATASKARQAQSRLKRLAALQPIAALMDQEVLPFHLTPPKRPLSPPLITLEGAAAGYDDKIVLDRLDLTILPDDRIALLGANGNGKSTFAKVLSGRLQPLKGKRVASTKLDVAFFAQHQLDELDAAGTPYSHVAALMPEAFESQRRARCAQLGFSGPRADTRISSLSGGEKARLQLGLACFSGPHLLILDEPTNHLDIDSRSALIEAINDYPGAVMLVSHDRHLIEATCERLWLVADGRVKPYDGDLDDYRKLILAGPETDESLPFGSDSARQAERRAAAEKRLSLAPLRKRQDALEKRMDQLSGLIARIDAALGDGQAFLRDPAKASALARQRAELGRTLEQCESDWLSLAEEIEKSEI
jgi:ATP-binding cassette, subfamily F, member 3